MQGTQLKLFGMFDLMKVTLNIFWIKLSSLVVGRNINDQKEIVDTSYEVMIYENQRKNDEISHLLNRCVCFTVFFIDLIGFCDLPSTFGGFLFV